MYAEQIDGPGPGTVLEMDVGIATAAQAEHVTATIVAAFVADPFVRYWFAEPLQFLSGFPAAVRAFGGRAFEHHSAWCTAGFAGGALWLPPGVSPDYDALQDVLLDAVAPSKEAEFVAVTEQMEAASPAEPHWYLPLMGVDPACHGRGTGSALLERSLARCDEERTLAYLEATSPRNIPLYRRHGFEPVGRIQAGDSPPLTPMLRRPRGGAP